MVSDRQFEAGERLRGDFTRAQIAPRTTMAWDAGPATRGARAAPEGLDATTAQLAAKRRFEAAVTAVGGGLSDILWRVVCTGEGLETAERGLGWPQDWRRARARSCCCSRSTGWGTIISWGDCCSLPPPRQDARWGEGAGK